MCEYIIFLIQLVLITALVLLQSCIFQIFWNSSMPIVFEYQHIPKISLPTSLCLIVVAQILFPPFEYYSGMTKISNKRLTTQDSESVV